MSVPRATVTGFRDITRAVENLQRRIARGAMRDSLTKAARVMTAEMKNQAPVRFGTLKKSIAQKIITNTKTDSVLALIGPSNKTVRRYADKNGRAQIDRPAKYAHLVEYGTKSRGSWGRKGATTSPGNPPNPFVRRTKAAKSGEVASLYKNGLAVGIRKTAEKLSRQKRGGGR